ncbi:MAG: hypothetical protein P1V20_18560 [Verrucomicrobiales bacterium]|nr:hypothetical protein [Verrucomicrobiales bacterium]
MKIKAFIAILVGAVAFQNASAGDWCPPVVEDKCPVDCCEDLPGSVSVGYDTAYVWKGVRLAKDSMWGDVNYTFDIPYVGIPINVGVWHLTSLGSWPAAGTAGAPGNDNYGDETNVYASIDLPSLCGFDHSVGYTWYTFPTLPVTGSSPDSFSGISYSISREIYCGVTLGYTAEYFLGQGTAFNGALNPNDSFGDWFHTLALSKSFDITDCVALDLSAEVGYSDELQSGIGLTPRSGGLSTGSGWNHYKLTAAVPLAVGRCATLTPYISYNGTPDGWVADDLGVNLPVHSNRNDVFSGGVSLSVGF